MLAEVSRTVKQARGTISIGAYLLARQLARLKAGACEVVMKSTCTHPRLAALLLLMLFTVAGCDASTASVPSPQATTAPDSAQVRDLEQILAGGPTFKDPASSSVTVVISTKIPVVCAAAYGVDTSYGKLATDTDMAGGPHSDHHPLLTGLQPDTEYHIRLQGVGQDGTLYRSKDYTYRTPKEAPGSAKPEGPNLALLSRGAQVLGVSSNFGGGDNASGFGANKALDGDPATQWSSNGDGDKAWIEIGLAHSTHVTTIGFWTRTMGTSAQISLFRVVADGEGSAGQQGGKVYGPFKLDGAGSIQYFPVSFRGQRLRFEVVSSSGGNTGAVEIEVYGQP